jgi:molybdopterin converting factor small subunit
MKIQVKLFATYRDYLPPESPRGGHTRGVLDIEAQEGETAVSILTRLDVPTDEASVVLINGRSPEPDQQLQEGDVVCAFPAIAGG